MTSNRTAPLRQRIGTRGTIGLVGATAVVTLTTGIALAYTGTLPLSNVQGHSGGSSQGSLGSIGAPGGPTTPAPTTDPTPTTGPTSTVELPPPAANEFPVMPRIAEVVAVEQQCHITVYYGPLAVDEGRSYVISVGSDRSVLGPTEIGDMGDGTSAYRLTDPVDYRERSLDRSYFAMEIAVGENGSQQALDDPIYHYLGHVPTPRDGECSTEGREIPVMDSGE